MDTSTKNTILIVDDVPENIQVLIGLLKDDYAIIAATNGEKALKMANAEKKPDLILLDIMMPGMDGYEVIKRLKSDEKTKDIPVIFVTAMGEVEDETKGFEFGAVDYIAKPIRPPIVKSRIQSVLNLKQKTEMLAKLSDKLSRYLSPQVYKSIFSGEREARIESRRKKLTIFFSDIVGFTSTTERLEAEEMSELLNSYLDRMSNIAIKHGGTIDKFMGDAIMVFFGDPTSKGTKEDALACVSMALEMRQALKELQGEWYNRGIETPFNVRAGINTGFCTVGNFGSRNRMDYTIIGGQVNIASRLETNAEPGQILISHETWSLINNKVYCIKKKPITLKGVSYPVQSYQIVDFHENIRTDEYSFAIGNLVGQSAIVVPETLVRDVKKILGDNPMKSAVVATDNQPLGLIMNLKLIQMQDSRSSTEMFFDHPVTEIMDHTPLIVESDTPLSNVASRAVSRDEGHAYDHIIVVENGFLKGTVSVQSMLERLAELHEEQRDQNIMKK